MPIGSRHDETGILVRDCNLLYLQRDAGGHWELDADDGAFALLGLKVRVVGVRSGFDRLSVKSLNRV